MSHSSEQLGQAVGALAHNKYFNVRRIARLLGLEVTPVEPGKNLLARVEAALKARYRVGQEITMGQDTAKIAKAPWWDNDYIAMITVELPNRGEVAVRLEDLLRGEQEK